MSGQKFFSFNYINQEATTFSVNSQNSNFPTSNLKDHRSTKVFRTASGVQSLQLVIDIKTTEAINSLIVAGDAINNGLGFTGSITLEGNTTPNFSSPAFSTTLTPSTEYNIGIKTFSDQSYRYWRIVASTTGNYVELSNIFLGKSISLTNQGIDFGWGVDYRDGSEIEQNRYFQYFADRKPTQRTIRASYKLLNKDELTTLLDMFKRHGTTEPIWFYVFDPQTSSDVNDPEEFMIMGRFLDIPTVTNTDPGLYSMSFRIGESL